MFTIEYLIMMILFVVMVACSIRKKETPTNGDVLIPPAASHILKAISCMIILMGHFALCVKDSGNIFVKIFLGGG